MTLLNNRPARWTTDFPSTSGMYICYRPPHGKLETISMFSMGNDLYMESLPVDGETWLIQVTDRTSDDPARPYLWYGPVVPGDCAPKPWEQNEFAHIDFKGNEETRAAQRKEEKERCERPKWLPLYYAPGCAPEPVEPSCVPPEA